MKRRVIAVIALAFALLPDTSWPACGRVRAIKALSRKSVPASIT
jgi:hypothetical protein